ncbi:hypothetical protein CYY_000035 [Polysphondylium violaceum]|uniref:Magnesium transporter n=1 Tax=Polysphondylium violaceum TaxID=133409 RepID=A0A8J4Q4G1_9MYCE|nr:hypothetical protein CYY_000035 [Polysphondylium violaceum]
MNSNSILLSYNYGIKSSIRSSKTALKHLNTSKLFIKSNYQQQKRSYVETNLRPPFLFKPPIELNGSHSNNSNINFQDFSNSFLFTKNSSSNSLNHNNNNNNNFTSTNSNNNSNTNLASPRIFDQEYFQHGNVNGGNINQANETLKSFKVTCIDINGNPTETKMYKSDLANELKLQARDLRTVDPSFPPQMPTILVRDKVILISIGCVRAIIQYNRVIIFETQNQTVKEEIMSLIRDSLNSTTYEVLPLPFEFKVFESMLDISCKKLEAEYRRMQSLVERELQLLNNNPEHNLEDLFLYHKKGLNQFEVTIKEIIDAITDLLQSDEDMALMYLSFRNATGGARRKHQHDEIEILLETYTRQLEQMSSNIAQLKETLNSTEEFVNFQLDTVRNKMMRMNLMLSLVTISTGFGGIITGTFGMNLSTGLESHPFAFWIACGAISVIGSLTFMGLRYYCQVKNILPYTKKTPARLKIGSGFRNDSFVNPLSEPSSQDLLFVDPFGIASNSSTINNRSLIGNNNNINNNNINNNNNSNNNITTSQNIQNNQQRQTLLNQQYRQQAQNDFNRIKTENMKSLNSFSQREILDQIHHIQKQIQQQQIQLSHLQHLSQSDYPLNLNYINNNSTLEYKDHIPSPKDDVNQSEYEYHKKLSHSFLKSKPVCEQPPQVKSLSKLWKHINDDTTTNQKNNSTPIQH